MNVRAFLKMPLNVVNASRTTTSSSRVANPKPDEVEGEVMRKCCAFNKGHLYQLCVFYVCTSCIVSETKGPTKSPIGN